MIEPYLSMKVPSVGDLMPFVARLKKSGIKVLEKISPWADTQVAMIG